mmetsp:Transcript_2102/g.7004  ORF Transcript_2102/g.7004 Transcript_2102/m.7004 type:complete len:337 (+) Transcript_2102:1445-2455(+)
MPTLRPVRPERAKGEPLGVLSAGSLREQRLQRGDRSGCFLSLSHASHSVPLGVLPRHRPRRAVQDGLNRKFGDHPELAARAELGREHARRQHGSSIALGPSAQRFLLQAFAPSAGLLAKAAAHHPLVEALAPAPLLVAAKAAGSLGPDVAARPSASQAWRQGAAQNPGSEGQGRPRLLRRSRQNDVLSRANPPRFLALAIHRVDPLAGLIAIKARFVLLARQDLHRHSRQVNLLVARVEQLQPIRSSRPVTKLDFSHQHGRGRGRRQWRRGRQLDLVACKQEVGHQQLGSSLFGVDGTGQARDEQGEEEEMARSRGRHDDGRLRPRHPQHNPSAAW